MNSQVDRSLATQMPLQHPRPSGARSLSYGGGYLQRLSEVPKDQGSTAVRDASSEVGGVDRISQPGEPLPIAKRIVSPVVRLPDPPARSYLKPLQQWEGVVVEVGAESFTARLHERDNERPEEADFPLSDVPDGDRSLLLPGAVFYLTIGYLITKGGQRSRISTLRFRRLPVWTEDELADARRRAQETRELLAWGETDDVGEHQPAG